ncbi:MAG: hypothetical protein NTX00_04335 [Candidatus Parcubacteria bacterium]|nr:hypothetical protein [Candidatus Parcubacteria bacterium]
MTRIKRFFFLVWQCLRWEVFGLDGITWNEFNTVINKEFCSAKHSQNASK